ncbi:TPA: hypothetical protein I1685_001977 [Staphylococcus pseudintermedius]|nr:hypothetical protein [Staphylococcus pseudintermedius]
METEKYPLNDLLVIGTKKSGKVQDDMNLLITKEVFYGETDIVAIYPGKRLVRNQPYINHFESV